MIENNLHDKIEKIHSKKKESERFVEKYKTRQMNDLEEYYKGAIWAFDYCLKILKE